MKYAILLLILALGGPTAFLKSQGTDKVCLTYPEFDYFADALVERNGLRGDTAILNKQIRVDDNVIRIQARQLDYSNEIILRKDTIIAEVKQAYSDLSVKYNKSEKKRVFNKNAAVTFFVTTLILGTIVFVK